MTQFNWCKLTAQMPIKSNQKNQKGTKYSQTKLNSRPIKMCLNETYSKVRIGKHMSDRFPIQNGLTQGDALSPLLLDFALEFDIRKVQENQTGLKLNGTHQLVAYADDVNLLGDNIDTINKTQKP
jgi:hypothetical protein